MTMPVTKEPKMVRVTFTAPEDLIDQVDQFAQERLEDRSTAIRQLIHEGLKTLLIDRVLQQYQRGGMTLREAAGRVGLGLNELIELFMQRGIPVSGEALEQEPDVKLLRQKAKEIINTPQRVSRAK
jgi:predicted HTH domain antitoxin